MFERNFKNQEVVIRHHKIGLGESKLIKVSIDRLPTGTMIEIPVYVFNAEEPGPTILLQGGLHGDEFNSVNLLRKMLKNDYFQLKRGCVVVVPLLNVFGFLNFSREVHGKDVNRSFPGSKRGSLASRIAYYHIKEIAENIDFAIDYHTGGEQRNNYPQIRYTKGSERGRQLAEIFQAPFGFASPLIAKSFRNEAAKNDVPVLVFEGGESKRFDALATEEGIAGALRVLAHFDMIDAHIAPKPGRKMIVFSKQRWIRAKISGLFILRVKNGDSVEKGQCLAHITDTYGETDTEVKAPFSGYIFCVNNDPVVHIGEALFHIGV